MLFKQLLIHLIALTAGLTPFATVHATPTLSSAAIMGAVGTGECAETATGGCSWTSIDYASSSSITRSSGTFSRADAPGTAAASGNASATSYLPELHAYARSNPAHTHSGPVPPWMPTATGLFHGLADANIWGVQGYRYIGEGAFDLSITATLDSGFSSTGRGGPAAHSSFHVSIFDTAGYSFHYQGFDDDGLNDLCPILASSRTRDCLDNYPTVFDHANGFLSESGSTTLTLHHWVNPGDEFYVGAFLDATACCGITVDSSHTLKLAFNDFTQLVNVDVPGVVPEPGSSTLIGLALTGLVMVRRRVG